MVPLIFRKKCDLLLTEETFWKKHFLGGARENFLVLRCYKECTLFCNSKYWGKMVNLFSSI